MARDSSGRRPGDFELLMQALRGEPLTIYGDGQQTRSFCYVYDLIEGILRLARSEEHFRSTSATLPEFTILECAQAVLDVTGRRANSLSICRWTIQRAAAPISPRRVHCWDGSRRSSSGKGSRNRWIISGAGLGTARIWRQVLGPFRELRLEEDGVCGILTPAKAGFQFPVLRFPRLAPGATIFRPLRGLCPCEAFLRGSPQPCFWAAS